MHLFLFCDNAARMNKSMLTDTQFMELFFVADDYENGRQELKGDADDACTWVEIRCSEDQKITHIDWHRVDLTLVGSLDMALMPPDLIGLNIYHQALRGEANTTELPQNLELLYIDHAEISGTLDLSNLPKTLVDICFCSNQITKIVNLCNLPESLKTFDIDREPLDHASLHIGKLPSNGLILNFYHCFLTEVHCENPADRARIEYQLK